MAVAPALSSSVCSLAIAVMAASPAPPALSSPRLARPLDAVSVPFCPYLVALLLQSVTLSCSSLNLLEERSLVSNACLLVPNGLLHLNLSL